MADYSLIAGDLGKNISVVTDVNIEKLNKFRAVADEASKSVKGLANSNNYLLMSLTRIATYSAIFIFFGTLIKLINEVFDAELHLAEIGTLIDKSNQKQVASFNQVKQQLLALSPYFGTLSELTKGFYEIMSAGIQDPIDAMKLLVISAQYTKVGLTDLGTSASMLTSVMLAYGFSADHMKQVTDVLFKSVAQGKFHAEDLNAAIGTILPTAAAMGLSIEEVSAALAFLSNRGLSASQSATALNRLLLSMLKPTKAAADAMTKMGIETGINAVRGIGLVGVLEKLKQGAALYDETLQVVFRRETGLRAVFALTGDLEGYRKVLFNMMKGYEDLSVIEGNFVDINKTVIMELKAWWAALIQAGQGLMNVSGTLAIFIGVFKGLSVFFIQHIVQFAQLGILYGGATRVLGGFTKEISRLNQLRQAQIAIGIQTGVSVRKEVEQYDAQIAKQQKLVSVFKFLRISIIAAALAYDIIGTAMRNAEKRNEDYYDEVEKQVQLYRNLKQQMIWFQSLGAKPFSTSEIKSAAIDLFIKQIEAATGKGKNFEVGIKGIVNELKAAEPRLGGFVYDTKNVHEAFGVVTKATSNWEKVLRAVAIALKEGRNPTEAMRGSLQGMVEALNLETIALAQNQAKLMQDPKFAETMFVARNKLSNALGEVNRVLGDNIREAKSLAAETPLDELQVKYAALQLVLEKFKDLTKTGWGKGLLGTANIKFDNVATLKSDLTIVLGFLKEAIGMKEGLDLLNMTEDIKAAAIAAVRAVQVTGTEAQATFNGLSGAWNELKSNTSMKVFAGENRQQIEKLLNSIMLFPKEIQNMINAWAKAGGVISGDTKKIIAELESLHEANASRTLEIYAKLAEQQNILEGDKAENIFVKTKLWADQKEALIVKDYARLVELNKATIYDYEDYIETLIALDKARANGKTIADKKMFDEYVQNLVDFATMYARINNLKFNTATEFVDAIMEMIDTTKMSDVQLEILREALLKVGLGFDGLDQQVERVGLQFLRFVGRALTELVTNLRDIQSSLGITSSAFTKLVNVFDAVAKGANTVITAIEGIATAKKFMDAAAKSTNALDKFAGALAGITSKAIVVIAIISAVVMIMTALIGADNYEAEAAERAADRQAEATAEAEKAAKAYDLLIECVNAYGSALEALNYGLTLSSESDPMLDPDFWLKLSEAGKTFSDFLNDSLITIYNIGGMWMRLQQVPILTINAGEVGKSFAKLVEAAKKFGTEGSKGMIEFIRNVKASGVAVQEVTDYINTQLGVQEKTFMNGVQGLTAMANAGGQTEESMARIARQARAVYDAMIANGVSVADAAASMAPALDAIAAAYATLGLEVPAVIAAMMHVEAVRKEHEALFLAIQGNLAVLNALGNTANLTQATLTDAAKTATDQFYALQTAGLTASEALAQMAPALSRLKYLAEQNNLTLDAGTQALIDQADAAGLITKPMATMNDLTDAFLAGCGLIVLALGGDIPDAMQDAIDKMYDLDDAGETTLGSIQTGADLTELALNAMVDGPIEKMRNLKDAGLDTLEKIQKSADGMDFSNMYLPNLPTDNLPTESIRSFARGGWAMHKQLAWVGEIEPERITPLSQLASASNRKSAERSLGFNGATIMNQIKIDLDGQTVYSGLKPYYVRDVKYGGIETSGDGVF